MPVIKLSFCKNSTILFVNINLVNLTYFEILCGNILLTKNIYIFVMQID